jgi:predicted NBD/HSP70 family sugar kinase
VLENDTQARILVALSRSPTPLSRARLAEVVGVGRNALSAEVTRLLASGLVEEGDVDRSGGGRPSRLLQLSAQAGVVAAVDVGATSLDVALTTLGGSIVAHRAEESTLADGPSAVLARALELIRILLDERGLDTGDVRAAGVGVPGPVGGLEGRPVAPPVAPGWHGFPIQELLGELGCPVAVDNDANAMAVAEQLRGAARGVDEFLYVKVGTGIGVGLVVDGRLVRGVDGGAGEVGHICVDPDSEELCLCGNRGCLQILSAGPAIAAAGERAARDGRSAALAAVLAGTGRVTAEDVGTAAAGDAVAIDILRQSGALIGETLATVVNLLNPGLVVMGGGVSRAGDPFLAAIRSTVYRRSLPLATRTLSIVPGELGPLAGVVGASLLAVETLAGRSSRPLMHA